MIFIDFFIAPKDGLEFAELSERVNSTREMVCHSFIPSITGSDLIHNPEGSHS
jgi:hypothetical protein